MSDNEFFVNYSYLFRTNPLKDHTIFFSWWAKQEMGFQIDTLYINMWDGCMDRTITLFLSLIIDFLSL